MACIPCTLMILQSDTTWGNFHSYGKLTSLPSECVICARVREDLEGYEVEDSTVSHRWTLRQSTKIRETAEVVIVTLRAVITLEKGGSNAYPPTRIFYLIPEKDLLELRHEDDLDDYTGSDGALSQVERWVTNCDKNHQDSCAAGREKKEIEAATNNGGKTSSTSSMPTRLLDVGLEANGPTLRIVETGSKTILGRYLTLSYCWGPKPWFRLERGNREQLMHEIRFSDLPTTFQHVVGIARRLKIRYVWIDALCIVQDNGEFLVEGQKMHQVYRNSTLNLAAVASEDSRGGLFRKRSPADIASTPIRIHGSRMISEGTWRIFSGDIWETQLLQEKLYSRGWVLQERLLSPRLVHFASKQLFWDCPKLSACETFPHGLPHVMDEKAAVERHWRERLQSTKLRPNEQLIGTADDSPEQLWRAVVHNYSSCALTNADADKLFAIWGVAKLVRDILKGEGYAAGMWQNNLHEQLAWRVADYKGARRMRFVAGKEIPSWSWASVTAIDKDSALKIVCPDRLVLDRLKNVHDHDGKAVAFKLAASISSSRDSTSLGTQNSLHNLITGKIDGSPFAGPPSDFQPELRDIRLAIRAHVFRITLQRAGSKWALKVMDTTQSHKKIEVFPDTTPSETKWSHEQERQKIDRAFKLYSDSNRSIKGQNDFATVIASSQVLRQEHVSEEEISEYHGFGLIMEYVGAYPRPIFQRTGMFRFQGFTQNEWQLFDRTYDQFLNLSAFETNEGLKFWLE